MRAISTVLLIIFAFCVSCATTTNPPFEWGQQRQNQSGLSIRLIEEKREMKSGRAEIAYLLEGKGFPAEDSFEFWIKNEERYERAGTISIDDQGKARWKSKTGTGGQFSIANLIAKGIGKVAGQADADIVRIILAGSALGKGVEVAVYDEKRGQVAFEKAPLPPSN